MRTFSHSYCELDYHAIPIDSCDFAPQGAGRLTLCVPGFYALADPARHELSYENALHAPPLLIRGQEGEIESLRYRQHTVAIGAGDILALFSEPLDERAVADVIRRHANAAARELVARARQAFGCTFAAVRVVGARSQPLPELEAVCAA